MAFAELDLTGTLSALRHKAVKLEGVRLRRESGVNLTTNEIHLIELVKLSENSGEGPSISSLADELDISRPTATVAVNKLEAKRMVEKTVCRKDGRSVRVRLTRRGERAYNCLKRHDSYLSAALSERFSDDERSRFSETLEKLGVFLDGLLAENAENSGEQE